jgi:glycosyltransferase involved in cell wall biosynthesis
MVDICCITFNHSSYIAQAINGFLIQKSEFPFRIIIHDDASTDSTQKIVKQFYENNPEIIIPIFQKENKYSRGINPMLEFILPKCTGKYLAFCEGDDFWTDPDKLQKQVEFLEANPEFSMVHTDVNHLYQDKNKLELSYNKAHGIHFPSGDIFDNLLKGDLFIKTSSVIVKRDVFSQASNYNLFRERKWLLSDLPTWLEIAYCTKIKYLEDTTTTYRLIDESASRTKNLFKMHKFHLSVYDVLYYYWKTYSEKPETKRIIDGKYANMMMGDAFKLNDRAMAREAYLLFREMRINIPFKEWLKYYLILFTEKKTWFRVK